MSDWKRACSVAVLLLAACDAGAPGRRAEQVNLSGYSPSFKQGYADGCESVGSRGPRRDEERYRAEADYRMGWNDGQSVCRRR